MDRFITKRKRDPPDNNSSQNSNQPTKPGHSTKKKCLSPSIPGPSCTDALIIIKPTQPQESNPSNDFSLLDESNLSNKKKPQALLDTCNENEEIQIATSNEEHKKNIPTKSKKASDKTEKHLYVFSEKWLEIKELSEWLVSDTVKGTISAKCKYCQTTLPNHKPHLIRHSETDKHKSIMKANKSTSNIKESLKPSDEDLSVKRGELKIAAMLATNNLPFLLSDTLVSLIADICPDSKIAQKMKMGRTKATAVVTQILGPSLQSTLHDYLKQPGNFFCLIMDETTDVGTKKQCAMTVIYCDKEFKIKTEFFDLLEMASGTADDLYNALIQSVETKNIPLENLVGFSSDTTNVMVGEYNSVFAKLKERLPNIVCVRCSCHMIHLAASKACLQLPKSVEDMLRNIGSHFSRSHNRQQKLAEMQRFYQTQIHQILLPATTRWLSLKACVDRTLEQYPALEAYFRLEIVEDPSRITESIIFSLRNQFTKFYLEFMAYVLDLLNDFNITFQSESPLLHKLKPAVEGLIRTIASNFIDLHHVKNTPPLEIEHKNPRLYLPLENLYLGVSVDSSLKEVQNDVRKEDLERFKLDCLAFYVEVIEQIKQRFIFTDPIYDIIQIVEPKIIKSFDPQMITSILNRFPFLAPTYLNKSALINEWREYCLLDLASVDDSISIQMNAADFWTKVFKLKDIAGTEKFKNLKILIGFLLILPFSNASVERVFSKLKLIKTEHRNRLNTETIAALMAISSSIQQQGGIHNFEPSSSMLNKKIKY